MEKSASTSTPLAELDRRARAIFRAIVETYLETGEPVGSRTISQREGVQVSSATVRNTMADLAALGLLNAPHISAGRIPTNQGLRLFVDGLLEFGHVTDEDKAAIERSLSGTSESIEDALERASDVLSHLAGGAGLVVSPASESPLRHVEFVSLSPGQALAVLVFQDGLVENRIMDVPPGVPPVALAEAANFLSARMAGRTLSEARVAVLGEIERERAALDAAARNLVEAGLAVWSGETGKRALIVRGRANLITDHASSTDLENVRRLFDELERKEGVITLLDQARDAQSVKIFIGAENPMFALSGSSVIAAPYKGGGQRVLGALGVIGPTRLNYGRIIPLVDYTARVVGGLFGEGAGS